MLKFTHLILMLMMVPACSTSPTNNECCVALPYDNLRNGDIVFRRGTGIASRFITMEEGNKVYSHIGIVHRNSNGCYVIHAVNNEPDFKGDFDRVKMDDIDIFFSRGRAKNGEILHSFLTNEENDSIIALAMQFVNDSIPFDADFNTDDHSEIYCTELIYILYNSVGIDITEGRRTLLNTAFFPRETIFPSDILGNKRLESYFKF